MRLALSALAAGWLALACGGLPRAGPDAEPISDGGAPDSGGTALGDAGSGDAGSNDAGRTDAGPPDSGLAGCPLPLPSGDVTSGGHTWHLVGQDDFTVDAPLGAWASPNADAVLYTGDHGMGWTEYPDGWSSTYTNGQPGYQPAQVLSVHDGVLDFWLHPVNALPSGANPSPLPGGTRYQVYGRYSACVRVVFGDASHLGDYHDAWLLWPQSDSDWQSAESDFPETTLDQPEVDAFSHYGGAGAQEAFNAADDWTRWHVYTQEWGPGFRNYYVDGALIGTATHQVWSQLERLQVQSEPSGSNAGSDGHQYVDWVAVWAW